MFSRSNFFFTVTGNFPTVTRVLLAKIPPSDGRMIYNYDDYVVSDRKIVRVLGSCRTLFFLLLFAISIS